MRKVYRITRQRYILDLSGVGSANFGGRWNPKGTYVLYTADNPSLAMLEWLAHARDRQMDEVYCMATLLLPEAPLKKLNLASLPAYWRDTPPSQALQQFGAQILAEDEWLGFEVPSVLMPLDYNVVLNTRHSLYSRVEIVGTELVIADERLIR
jgi:RES domain-containing protein